MSTITLTKNAWIDGHVVQVGTQVEATQEAVDAAYAAFEREKVREAIAAAAGDSDTLLGSSIDVGHLLLVGVGRLVAKIAEAQKLEDVRAAAKALSEILAPAVAGRYPYQMDGAESVIAEVVQRAEKTVAAFEGKPVNNPATPTSPEATKVPDAAPAAPYVSPTGAGFYPNRAADGTSNVVS